MNGRPQHTASLKRWARICAGAAIVVALVVGTTRYSDGLTVSVAEFRLAADPATDSTVSFVILNEEPRPVDVSLGWTDWDDGPDGVTRLFPVGEVDRSCAAWLIADAKSFSLNPFEERTVDVQVTVPAGICGTYWAGLVVRFGSPTDGAADVSVTGEFLVRFFITAPAEESAAVTGLSLLSLQPFRVLAHVTNTGDVRLVDVQGVVSVEGPAGQSASFSIPSLNLLPGHSVGVEGEAPWGLDKPGLYLLRVVFDYGAEVLIAGQVVVRVP